MRLPLSLKRTTAGTPNWIDFSLEYGGSNAWIDELFVQREFRSGGIGSRALDFAAEPYAVTASDRVVIHSALSQRARIGRE